MRILITGAHGLLTAALLAAISSCTTIEVVTKYEQVPVLPPEGMIQLCDIAAPPILTEYIGAPWEVREELLTSNITKHLLNQNVCNVRIAAYLTWRRKQELLFKSKQGEKRELSSSTK